MLTELELLDIMNSDFKLWEKAETQDDGETLVKSLELPYNIGVVSLSFTGVKGAAERREACDIWGEHIRNQVDNAIGEAAVTARAKQAAALSKPTDRGQSRAYVDEEAEESPVQDAIQAYEIVARGPTASSNRLDEVELEIEQTQKRLASLLREKRALEAYMEIINAYENEEQAQQYSDRED